MEGGVLRVRTKGEGGGQVKGGETEQEDRGRLHYPTSTVPQLSYTAFVCSHNCVIVSSLNGPKGVPRRPGCRWAGSGDTDREKTQGKDDAAR